MPAEVIEIPLTTRPTWEAGSHLFAALAYPNNQVLRERFRISLCTKLINEVLRVEPAAGQDWLTPAMYRDGERHYKKGITSINNGLISGEVFYRIAWEIEGGAKTITSISRLMDKIKDDIGRSKDEFIREHWPKHRNILHIAGAVSEARRIYLKQDYLPDEWTFIIKEPLLLAAIVTRSEQLRTLIAPAINTMTKGPKRFSLNIDEMLQLRVT